MYITTSTQNQITVNRKLDVYDHFKLMKQKHLILGYRGSLNNDLITSLLQLSDNKLKEQKAALKQKKVIINVLIECLQNIIYHSAPEPDSKDSSAHCIIMIGKNETDYYIQVGNFINSENVFRIKNTLDHLNSLNLAQIKQLYLEILDKGHFSDKGGAGLGILRMIKETGNSLEYEFVNIDEQLAFFCMNVKVAA